MPAKNSIKQFVENSYYHLYNRGVEKRVIFLDGQDYAVFLSYLKAYLLPKDSISLQKTIADSEKSTAEKQNARKLLRLNNFSETISLAAYCLMPNHFHFLVKQTDADTIDRFMNSLCTRYSMYLNRKLKRVGPLYQGLYKAVLVETDEQLLHLSRYIHRNPIGVALQGSALSAQAGLHAYPYSSYSYYISGVHPDWIKPDSILAYFGSKGKLSYQSFVEGVDNELSEITYPLLIDENEV